MSDLSNEQLETLIPEFDKFDDKRMANALRELLAYREAQGNPVAWEVKGILCHTLEEANVYVGEPEPLYAAPHLHAVPVKYSRAQGVFDGEWEMGYESGWNACRAAMSIAP